MNIEIKEGIVSNDGNNIGKIRDGICYSASLIPGRVKGEIRKTAGDTGMGFVVEAPPVILDAVPTIKESLTVQPAAAPEVSDVIETPVMRDLKRVIALADAGKIPQPPKTRPDLGDKTPEYVDWYRENATPEEFYRRYAHRLLPTYAQADEGERQRRAKLDMEEARIRV